VNPTLILTFPPSLSLLCLLFFFFPSSLYKPSLTLLLSPSLSSSLFLLYIEENGKGRKGERQERERGGRRE